MIPDKIYFPADGLPSYIDWDGSPIRIKQVDDSDICYIHKDIVNDMLKTAEDHAFLAGADWQKEQLMKGKETQQKISERFEEGMSFNMGKIDG